jgi:hypothetical protein
LDRNNPRGSSSRGLDRKPAQKRSKACSHSTLPLHATVSAKKQLNEKKPNKQTKQEGREEKKHKKNIQNRPTFETSEEVAEKNPVSTSKRVEIKKAKHSEAGQETSQGRKGEKRKVKIKEATAVSVQLPRISKKDASQLKAAFAQLKHLQKVNRASNSQIGLLSRKLAALTSNAG